MKRQPTISQIENAFQPAKEIDVPDRFAGRHQSVIDCYYALTTQGASLAIVLRSQPISGNGEHDNSGTNEKISDRKVEEIGICGLRAVA